MKDFFIVTFFSALLFSVVFGGVFIVGRVECEAKASVMQMRHTYGFVQGCMIEPASGQWIPLANYRLNAATDAKTP